MGGPSLSVLVILALAIGYLALRTLRTLRRSRPGGSSCDSDDCGCGH